MSTPPVRKSLGQHFLHQQNVIDLIVQHFAPNPNDTVIEIGPGRGALTFQLASKVNALHVVEIDPMLIAKMRQDPLFSSNILIHHQDALTFDYCSIDRPVRVIGNLPYNISTPLLFRLMDHMQCIDDMTLMLQKEVVDRIAASPGSRCYGRLSVMIQQKFQVERFLRVSPGAFQPPPKVDSAVIRLSKLSSDNSVDDQIYFARLVRMAFSKRRKMLRNTLHGLLTSEQIQACGIDPMSRAEQLSVADFERLSNYGVKIQS